MTNKKNKKKKITRIAAPFEQVEFYPHEWGTVAMMFLGGLASILQKAPKYSQFRIDVRMYKVNRQGKEIKNEK